jgi:hypothetical protein
MAKLARPVGFGKEELAGRFPVRHDSNGVRGGRHGHGLGFRLSRYVGKHRVLEETNGHRAQGPQRRRAKKVKDYGFGS